MMILNILSIRNVFTCLQEAYCLADPDVVFAEVVSLEQILSFLPKSLIDIMIDNMIAFIHDLHAWDFSLMFCSYDQSVPII